MDREQFIKTQAAALDQFFSFTTNEDEARARFERLALDSYDFLQSVNMNFYRGFNPTSGWPFRDHFGPPELMQRWRGWQEEYRSLRSRHPQRELYDLMHEISESHNASSWPDGLEGRIQSWVDAGDPRAKPPFDDRYGIVTVDFFNRLRELRQSCRGWLYYDNDLRRVVFALEPEWQKVRARQEAARKQLEQRLADAKRTNALREKRLAELLVTARGDLNFWNGLRQWELAREAQRPTEPPPPNPGQITGRIGISQGRKMSTEESYKFQNPPLDPLFAEFVARFRQPDDVLTPLDIVLNLRSAMRRELGLDGIIGWSGGPGLGVSSS